MSRSSPIPPPSSTASSPPPRTSSPSSRRRWPSTTSRARASRSSRPCSTPRATRLTQRELMAQVRRTSRDDERPPRAPGARRPRHARARRRGPPLGHRHADRQRARARRGRAPGLRRRRPSASPPGSPTTRARPSPSSSTRWLGFFEPDDGVAPRLGVAVAPAAVASRMRRAVGLPDRHGILVLKVKRSSAADGAGLDARRPRHRRRRRRGPHHRRPAPRGAPRPTARWRSTSCAASRSAAWRWRSADLLEVDVEDQGLVGPDLRRRPLRAVGEVGGNRQAAALADLHPQDALVPARDDLARAQRELEGLLALAPRGVELLAVLEQHADVVDRRLLAALDLGAVAGDQRLGLQRGRRGAACPWAPWASC